jgi:hypothetical protein
LSPVAESLDGGDHARLNILTAEQTAHFRQDTSPGTGRELAQQAAVESPLVIPMVPLSWRKSFA